MSTKFIKILFLTSIIVLSFIGGSIIYFTNNVTDINLSDITPAFVQTTKDVELIITFDSSDYTNGLVLTLRSLQALVNTQRPNGTVLYFLDHRSDAIILHEIYGKGYGIPIYSFNQSSNIILDLRNLIALFKNFIRGFVLFNESEKVIYPAIINYLSNYGNALAIPYPYFSLLPENYIYLEMQDFINKTTLQDNKTIIDLYLNQINTFSKNLAGIAIWDNFFDELNFLDFPINQKYWLFPKIFIDDPTFSALKNEIFKLEKSYLAKPIINHWPIYQSRIESPLYANISKINNLSFHISPFSTNFQFSTKLTDFFLNSQGKKETIPSKTINNSIIYSIVINPKTDSLLDFYYSVLPALLDLKHDYLTNVTLIYDDSSINLFKEIFFWIINNHSNVYLLPRVKLSSTTEEIYYPGFYNNSISFLEQISTPINIQYWSTKEYLELLNLSIKGYISSDFSNKTYHGKDVKPVTINYSDWSTDNYTTLATRFIDYLNGHTGNNRIIIYVSSPINTLVNDFEKIKFAFELLKVEYSYRVQMVHPNIIYDDL